MLDLRFTNATSQGATWRTVSSQHPALVLRLAPLTVTRRWREWAVSHATVDELSALVAARAGAAPGAQAAATCSDYETQADAQRAADTRDSDGDGRYCVISPR